MSQNASRLLVESIARAANVKVEDRSQSVLALTDRIVQSLEAGRPGGASPEPADAGPASFRPASSRPAGSEPASPTSAATGDADARMLRSAAPAATQAAAATLAPAGEANLLRVAYPPRATRLDAATQAGLDEALRERPAFAGAARILIRAFAVPEAGALTDARRVAYGRAMALRAALLASGTRPERLRVEIRDDTDPALARQAWLMPDPAQAGRGG
jgi:hypothetical protein